MPGRGLGMRTVAVFLLLVLFPAGAGAQDCLVLTPEQAVAHVREVFAGYDLEVVDQVPGAPPALAAPAAREFVAAVGATPVAKLGWTDVARFVALGIPALNYGPGDPNLAHAPDEHVELTKIVEGAQVLRRWLGR